MNVCKERTWREQEVIDLSGARPIELLAYFCHGMPFNGLCSLPIFSSPSLYERKRNSSQFSLKQILFSWSQTATWSFLLFLISNEASITSWRNNDATIGGETSESSQRNCLKCFKFNATVKFCAMRTLRQRISAMPSSKERMSKSCNSSKNVRNAAKLKVKRDWVKFQASYFRVTSTAKFDELTDWSQLLAASEGLSHSTKTRTEAFDSFM